MHLNKILTLGVAFIFVAFISGFVVWKKYHVSPVGAECRVEKIINKINANIDAENTALPPENLGKHDPENFEKIVARIRSVVKKSGIIKKGELIEFARKFVYDNATTTGGGVEYSRELDKVLPALLQSSEKRGEKVAINCGPRALAMLRILEAFNIPCRFITVWSGVRDGRYRSHSFVEAYNDDTKSWQIEDPLFNIYYVNKKDGTRVSTKFIFQNGFDSVFPSNGAVSGWKELDLESLKKYFCAIAYDMNWNTEFPIAVIIIKKDRMDPLAKGKDNIDFFELYKGFYKNPVFIVRD